MAPSRDVDVHAAEAGLRSVLVGSFPLPSPSWWYTGQLVPNTVWGDDDGRTTAALAAEGRVTTTVPHSRSNALAATAATESDDRRPRDGDDGEWLPVRTATTDRRARRSALHIMETLVDIASLLSASPPAAPSARPPAHKRRTTQLRAVR
jgi:hypothetical protein